MYRKKPLLSAETPFTLPEIWGGSDEAGSKLTPVENTSDLS